MKKRLRAAKNLLFWVLLGCIGLVLLGYWLWPRQLERYLPLRVYTVLTDSMAPFMPPMSLVVVRHVPPQAALELQPEQIITFRADRFGQEIFETHRFAHTEWDEELGQTIYRTHPQLTDRLDHYTTTRQDIMGVYLFHIPWAGRILLFLKSPWGLVLLGEELVIFLINRLIRARWQEREQAGQQPRKRRGRALCAAGRNCPAGRWRYTSRGTGSSPAARA